MVFWGKNLLRTSGRPIFFSARRAAHFESSARRPRLSSDASWDISLEFLKFGCYNTVKDLAAAGTRIRIWLKFAISILTNWTKKTCSSFALSAVIFKAVMYLQTRMHQALFISEKTWRSSEWIVVKTKLEIRFLKDKLLEARKQSVKVCFKQKCLITKRKRFGCRRDSNPHLVMFWCCRIRN